MHYPIKKDANKKTFLRTHNYTADEQLCNINAQSGWKTSIKG